MEADRQRPNLLIMSQGVNRISTLPSLLHDYRLCYGPGSMARKMDAVLAWGLKPSAMAARQVASKTRRALITVEDGFLRSIEPGSHEPPLSLVVDDLGIYYDSSKPSRLEQLVALDLTDAMRTRAQALQLMWQQHCVSKYNAARITNFVPQTPSVLVADQTLGDASLQGAGIADFKHMLDAALHTYPDCKVLLKVHPEVLAGRKQGHFDLQALRHHPRIEILDQALHPAELLPHMRAVFVMTSQLGFDALLWKVPVHTFGMPFYAGWGLTSDALKTPERRHIVSLEQLIHAALVVYPRYVHPETGTLCTPERLIEWLGLQRRTRSALPANLQLLGFSRWKRPHAKRFFDGSALRLAGKPLADSSSATAIATWGCKHDHQLLGAQSKVIRVEDGFLRSVGLGAAKNRPLSWVLDDLGIYYDATRPSRLESIFQEGGGTSEQLARAKALRHAICEAGVTKYNLPGSPWTRPSAAKKVILVTGQVESDASIRFGANSIRSNLQLLKAVRGRNPQAWLLYRPHPETLAARGSHDSADEQSRYWCDEVVGGCSFQQLLNEVDEVHVLTSQSGFEALLRGVPVTTYGQPFYAGWGLTTDLDMHPTVQARRQRTLTMDELVLGCLILYPTYVSCITNRFTTPEQALLELQNWHELTDLTPLQKWLSVYRRWGRQMTARLGSTS